MEKLQPFQRKIHPDELWLYKNPVTESYVPSKMLWVNMNIKM
jgi:diacylglycerol diphosphate phosphatase/phosphatidate phosphatase